MTLTSLCRALLVLEVLYCVLAALQDGVPGWHMFESVERLDYEMRDRDGRVVDVRTWLPAGANLVQRGELRDVVSFVCERERTRAPFTYTEASTRVRVMLGASADADSCKIHVPR